MSRSISEMSDSNVIKILFVCYGNTCRSPMAEAVFKDQAKKLNLESKFRVDSAGISSFQAGQEPNDFVKMILNRYGISFDHKARQITVADFSEFEYMLGMDAYNQHELNRASESLNSQTKIHLLGEFNPDESDKMIADPYFDNRQEDFEKCFDQISKSCERFLNHLIKQ